MYAPADGKVVLAEPLQVRGQVVILDHGLGVMSGYWHLSQIDVTAGQFVEEGQVIGLVGNTGLSTGSHLHWEVRVGGVPVDPIPASRACLRRLLNAVYSDGGLLAAADSGVRLNELI